MKKRILAFALSSLAIGCSSLSTHSPSVEDEHRDLIQQLSQAAQAAGYRASVRIDEHGVPHLGGSTSAAVYFAQGFTHAYLRLAQMELASRMVEGTFSEVRGPEGLVDDRTALYFGLDRAAKRSLEKINADPVTRAALEAYVAGVNARISRLTDKTIPLEFRHVGMRPREFKPLDSARIMTSMAWGLSNSVDELKLTKTLAHLGAKDFAELFPWPDFSRDGGIFRARHRFQNRAAPKRTWIGRDDQIVDISVGSLLRPTPNTGSNTFSIIPSKTESGSSILGADSHARYALPGILLPMQLVSPEFNVIGGSIVGLPMIATGTNGDVAWSYVASLSDTYDWFRLEGDPKNADRYRWNGQWKEFESETIELRPRGAETEWLVRRLSIAGEMVPVLRAASDPDGKLVELAHRWAGSDGINGLRAYLDRMMMKSAAECGAETSRDNSPALNLMCIDRKGRRGVWMMSKLPIRPPHQDPRLVGFANSDRDIWRGYHASTKSPSLYPIPEKLQDPVVISNQFARSPSGKPYVGWKFAPPARARRLEKLLKEDRVWNIEDAMAVLGDITSAQSEWVRPRFLEITRRYVAENPPGLSVCAKEVVERIEKWDGRYEPDSHEAFFMNAWMRQTEHLVWYNRIGPRSDFEWPIHWKIAELTVEEPNSKWWDYKRTSQVETSEEIVRWGLESTCEYFAARKRDGKGDRLIDATKPRFLTAFHFEFPKTNDLRPPGGTTTVFLQSGTYGTIYRAIISLDPKPRYWAITPGGPSGNSESAAAGSWMSAWADRKIFELPVFSFDEFNLAVEK